MGTALAQWQCRRALAEAAQAAERLLEISTRLAHKGITVPGLLVGGATPAPWIHFPDCDAVDTVRRYRYYYHVHPRRPQGEHGHFHLFRHTGRRERPATHLIGIAVDPYGLPLRVFTTNRWVTDEYLLPAAKVLRYLRRFRMDRPRRLQLVHDWLRALITVFGPTIVEVLRARDARIGAARPTLLEDRRIEILSASRISLTRQIAMIERLIKRRI
ncbi:hypothetical protein SAMN04488120_102338 [Fontimonas thermophila]|uniref:DUF6969 domain-containing protein n=1 Tax=Fontimonas thermophila TaxID=1076937 RepID=A0A1I2HXL3_9GAMM|nr:hypothetical protein [Fontimonas thermophila]SFF34789.1 hypothetical protein SAMN04488120_102338 [Fontimonas thermophila]